MSIVSLQQGNAKKLKNYRKWIILKKKIFIHLSELRNFNEILKKDLAYDYIKQSGFHTFSEKHIFVKTTDGMVKLTQPPSAVLGLIDQSAPHPDSKW